MINCNPTKVNVTTDQHEITQLVLNHYDLINGTCVLHHTEEYIYVTAGSTWRQETGESPGESQSQLQDTSRPSSVRTKKKLFLQRGKVLKNRAPK